MTEATAEAMFIPLGEGRFTATDNTGGPWDAQVQHGGPPSALLARALEALPGLGGPVTRVSVDLLGPVPLGDVSVTARVERPGRSVELLVAELAAGGRTAARATGWRIRTQELDLPPGPDRGPTGAPALPDEDSPSPQWPGGFLRAMQWRVVEGDWSELGPATVWGRMRVPLVSGEQPSRLCRVMVLADCGNGASAALPHADWVFINPDLTVHLARVPRGEWLCLEARTALDPSGFGLARSRIYDAAGLVAAGEQTLYVGRR